MGLRIAQSVCLIYERPEFDPLMEISKDFIIK